MDKQSSATTKTEGAASCGSKEKPTALEALFEAHLEHDSAGQDDVNRCFRELLSLLDGLSDDTLEAVTDKVCKLCETCDYIGFFSGMQTAIQLIRELND